MATPQERGTTQPHALIIGAGIAGCTLALFLKRIGVRATIFEAYSRSQASEGIGGGLQIAPNGMCVLQELGLARVLEAKGIVSNAFAFKSQQGRTLAVIPNGPKGLYAEPAVVLTRAAVHITLLEEVEKQGIHVQFCKRLTHLTGFESFSSSKKVVAYFEDGSEAEGDFLVGADGVNSPTRSIILGENAPKPQFLGLMSTGGFAYIHEELDLGTMNFLFGPSGGSFGYCQVEPHNGKERIMWWRNVYVGEDKWGRVPTKEDLRAIPVEELKRMILDVPGGWSPLAQRLVNSTDEIIRGTIQDLIHLPRWYNGRAVLIGDAAHAVSPHSGQGASMALEDAMYLAKVIRAELSTRKGNDLSMLEAAFEEFERGRRGRTESIVKEGRRRGERKELKKSGPLKQWITVLVTVLVLNLLGTHMMKQVYKYRIEWDEEQEKKKKKRTGSWFWWAFIFLLIPVVVVLFSVIMS